MRQPALIHHSLCLFVAAALGCGSGGPSNDASNPKDAHDGGDTNNAVDTTQPDGLSVDMVVDAPVVDTAADVGVDTGLEAGTEAQPETPADSGTDVHADAGSDSGTEVPSEAGAGAVVGPNQAGAGSAAGPPH